MMIATLERPTARSIQPLDFTLPPELEARVPAEARGLARDEVRLMVSRRCDNGIQHTRFRNIGDLLEPGDLVVVNDSSTLPAALTAIREDGSEIALHLSSELEAGMWVVEPRKAAGRQGERLSLRVAAARG